MGRGQFFSYDAIIATVVFLIAAMLVLNYWWSSLSSMSAQYGSLMPEAVSVSSSLLTQGSPANWDATNAKRIGLAKGANSPEIDQMKFASLRALASSDYEGTKGLLGTRHQFFISLSDSAGPLACGGSDCIAGEYPSAIYNPMDQVTIERIVLYEGKSAKLSIILWENYTS
ncbi:MAG: hypothetical protein NT157_01980 [Candidatus Micrarchaeota archaeon]|nr:hypothetical protein [Candidatus Micrarchaeota archaeon]